MGELAMLVDPPAVSLLNSALILKSPSLTRTLIGLLLGTQKAFPSMSRDLTRWWRRFEGAIFTSRPTSRQQFEEPTSSSSRSTLRPRALEWEREKLRTCAT